MGKTLETVWWGPVPQKAPTIVLLHDGLGSARQWRDFPACLAEATGFGVMAYSRFGYGSSSECELPRPTDYMEREGAVTLPEVLRAAAIENFLLFGHSDGGSIALLYALGNPHPGLMGVITEAAHVFCEELTLSSIRLAVQAHEEGALREKLLRHHGQNADFAFGGWSTMWLNPAFTAFDFRMDLRRLRVPLLALQGSDDEYGTVDQLKALLAAPLAQTLLIPGCGHTPHRDCPETVLTAVSGFVTRLTVKDREQGVAAPR